MPDTNKQEEIELLAELVGTTNAQLKKLDGEIISSSANLKTSSEAWNPHEIVKQHIAESGAPAPQGAPPPPPPSIPPAGVHPAVHQHPPPQQVYTQPANQPVVQVVTREFEDRLEQVEKKLDHILTYIKESKKLDEKISGFVDRGLKNKVKQITLKLDDTKD